MAVREMTDPERRRIIKRRYLEALYHRVNTKMRAEGVDPKSYRVKLKPHLSERFRLPFEPAREPGESATGLKESPKVGP